MGTTKGMLAACGKSELKLDDMRGRLPGEGRYAHVEREQRWQLRMVPSDATNARLIIDHYIVDTTLRLRMVEEPDGAVYKLSQKVRATVDNPELVKITNTYLTANEFDLLCILPCSIIAKNRWSLTSEGHEFAVDEFRGRHFGLVLAEREFGEDEARLAVPEFAVVEVTQDNQYSGGWLSTATDAEIHRLIATVTDDRRIS